jgi:acyl carrier protein
VRAAHSTGFPRGDVGGPRGVRSATFSDLVQSSHAASPPDPFVQDIVDILKRVSRLPIEPTLDSELLADLGFDSLQVLELVGEIEDHFKITVPPNDLARVRTVAQVAAEVWALVATPEQRT